MTTSNFIPNLQGKRALVTGGAAGIGAAIARAYAELGAHVAVLDRDAERIARARETMPQRTVFLQADVSDSGEARHAVAEAGRQLGGLDLLVNNVGGGLGRRKSFAESTEAEWEALYGVNLKHMFLVTHAALPLLRAVGGGSIINISTIEAFRGIPVSTVYSAFKSGVTGFTRSLALELAADRIRVNAIAPETTHTEYVDLNAWLHPEHRDKVDTWIPLGRFGLPDDAAGAAVFLASELSSWITGTTINLDGGALAACGWVRMPDGRWTHRPVVTGSAYRNP